MKGFLLNENLPKRSLFSPSLPIVLATELGDSPSDSQLWDFAREKDLVIVSKDADFSARIIVQQPPRRVVHLRFGNLRLKDFHAVLGQLWPQIELSLETNKLVNVYRDRVEGIG